LGIFLQKGNSVKKIVFIVLWGIGMLYAQESGSVKVIKLTQKGERIAHAMCDKAKLPKAAGTIEELMEKIKLSKACTPLSESKLKAVAYFVSNGSIKKGTEHIHVPSEAKCPVCGMFVSKYPKWTTMMEHDGKIYYFDGVKDMMKYYIFDGDFIYDRAHITQMKVSDYYTLEAIPAKEAFYVLDSDVFGPMGRELIPFKSLKSAEDFSADHNGRAIVKFDGITDSMLMKLDGMGQ
jgi:nitrous oxide reductase accessory protein NosL